MDIEREKIKLELSIKGLYIRTFVTTLPNGTTYFATIVGMDHNDPPYILREDNCEFFKFHSSSTVSAEKAIDQVLEKWTLRNSN